MKPSETSLEVVVSRVCYPKQAADMDSGEPVWHILATDKGTCKGRLSWRPFDGERLSLSGVWKAYQGSREFQFSAAVPNVPIEPRDSLHYAAERTLGIGPALEQAIWDARGADWPQIAAGEVPRLDGAVFAAFIETRDAMAREKDKSEAIAWMLGHGATVAVGALAWERWALQTRATVTSDPYRLDELPGYGFSYVDRSVRGAFGVADGDSRRIRAAIRYAMTQFGDDGNSAVSWPSLHDRANEILGGTWSATIESHADAMFADGTLQPFSLGDWQRFNRRRRGRLAFGGTPPPMSACPVMISLASDAAAAAITWTYATIPTPPAVTAESTPFDAPPPVTTSPGPTLDESQLAAVSFALAGRLAIITGGAGTGKTMIIRRIADQADSEVALCAFAGKAAARVREATGKDASTVHRLLGFRGTCFTTTTLRGRTVIVDEASMLDEALLAEIIKREPARLILVGDDAQLPPVGRGQPFHDLIRLRPDIVRRLTKCYRQTEAVFKAASMVRDGDMPPLHLESAQERWDIRAVGEAEETEAAVLELVKEGALDFAQDILLTPRNGTGDADAVAPCTVRSLNLKIRELVNPDHGSKKVDVNDRVICTKNFAGADVWNGTTGKVHSVDTGNQVWVKTDLPVQSVTGEPTDMVLFNAEMRLHLELAYALTVHKSQGSQYRNVIFVALYRDTHMLLDRRLAYTAVTRAKSTCTVIGQPRAFQEALRRVGVRTTALQEVAKANSEARE